MDLGKRQILYLFINSLNRYVNLKNIAAFYQDKVKEVLKTPEDINVVALMLLGFPQTFGMKRGKKLYQKSFVIKNIPNKLMITACGGVVF